MNFSLRSLSFCLLYSLVWPIAIGSLIAGAGCVSVPAAKPFAAGEPNPLPPYELFTPAVVATQPNEKRPLVVVLHGCLQTANAVEKLSRMDDEANHGGFFVLYPEQKLNRHPMNCWRWFDPENRKPGTGELAEIMSVINEIKKKHPIDASKIYVAGLSSGGAEAAALLSCYPNDFAGGALIAAPAFGVAMNEKEGEAALATPPARLHREMCHPGQFKGPVFITTGTADRTVSPRHALILADQFTTKAEKANQHFDIFPLTRPGTHATQTVCFGNTSRVCRMTIDKMAHAWPGGTLASFSDPEGPSAAELIRRYLIEREAPQRDKGTGP